MKRLGLKDIHEKEGKGHVRKRGEKRTDNRKARHEEGGKEQAFERGRGKADEEIEVKRMKEKLNLWSKEGEEKREMRAEDKERVGKGEKLVMKGSEG